jgi:transcription initiation factor TFIID subunit 8
VVGRETGMEHVSMWPPVFSDLHTYMSMQVWVEPSATKEKMDKVE